jgi:hypothetical protein
VRGGRKPSKRYLKRENREQHGAKYREAQKGAKADHLRGHDCEPS